MPNRYEEAAKRAANTTNEEYASEISSLTRLKDSEINRLFPTRADKDGLLELLSIVNSVTNENEKIVKLKKNIDNLAGTVIKLVKLLT